jgi:hypothetical protein
MDNHKKHTAHKGKGSVSASSEADTRQEEQKSQTNSDPEVVSDVVIESTVSAEVIEVPKASPDPLAAFKEKMSEDEHMPYNTKPQKNFMWPILLIFIIAILVLGGIFIYKKDTIGGEKINVETINPTLAPTSTPEPTIAPDLTKYEIEILNGSEVNGEAGRQQINLEEEGFTVSSTGNADSSGYTTTIIQAKEDVDEAFLVELRKALEASFVLGDQEVLPEDADSDVVIILGSESN